MADEVGSQSDSSPSEQMNLFSDMAERADATDAGAPEAAVKAGASSNDLPPAPEVPTAAPASSTTAEAASTAAGVQGSPPTPSQPQQPQPPEAAQQYMTTEEVLARRAAYLQQLAAQYTIPEDQVDMLTTEPHKVLPNLAAGIAMNTYEAITQYFNSMMPQYINHVLQQQAMQRNGTDRFYESWPQLRSDDPNVMKTISTVAVAYRRANPTASVEEAIAKVGAASAAMLGMSPAKPTQQPRTPSAKPFSHSGAGLAGGPAPTPRGTPQDNFFAELVNGLDLSEL